MGTRLELHETLVNTFCQLGRWLWDPFNFETDDIETAIRVRAEDAVFYQPPETFKLTYPCIVYALEGMDTRFADNRPYARKRQYRVTLITKDPDSDLVDILADLPLCSPGRTYRADNLYHHPFTIYY